MRHSTRYSRRSDTSADHSRHLRNTTFAQLTACGPVFGTPQAYAAEPQILAANSLPVIISNITAWIIGILVGVATLFLTIGGLRYMAAGGDPTEIEKAKSAFKSALLGYALAVLAPILLAIVQGWIGG